MSKEKQFFQPSTNSLPIQGGQQEVTQKLPELLTGNMIWMNALLDFLTLPNKVVSS